MKSYDHHEFAFYAQVVKTIQRDAVLDMYELTDPELVHRIVTVLRLEKGEEIILFNEQFHVKASIVALDAKRSVMVQLRELLPNKQLSPPIHWILPLLKRELFEEALYMLTELGATSIQPVLTQKTTRFWSEGKEQSRALRIMRAAAEQSKQFVLPEFHPIVPLSLWLLKMQSPQVIKVFFDPAGIPLPQVLVLIEHHQEIIACAGPEGDLSYEEKLLLTDQGFVFCALTPTILRAQQAITVGLGALRSLLS